jgi:hypothetical protein
LAPKLTGCYFQFNAIHIEVCDGAAGKEPIDDQSHNGGQQATKVGGNHGAGRARNNQPLMGAAKAGGGWQ